MTSPKVLLIAIGGLIASCVLAVWLASHLECCASHPSPCRSRDAVHDGGNDLLHLLVDGKYSEALNSAMMVGERGDCPTHKRDEILEILCHRLEDGKMSPQEMGVWSGWCAENELFGPYAMRWCRSALSAYSFVGVAGYYTYTKLVLGAVGGAERYSILDSLDMSGKCTVAGRAYCSWHWRSEALRLALLREAVQKNDSKGLLQIALEVVRWDCGVGVVDEDLAMVVSSTSPVVLCALAVVCPAMIPADSVRGIGHGWYSLLQMGSLDSYRRNWIDSRSGSERAKEWLTRESRVAVARELWEESDEGLLAAFMLYQVWCRKASLNDHERQVMGGILRMLQYACPDRGVLL